MSTVGAIARLTLILTAVWSSGARILPAQTRSWFGADGASWHDSANWLPVGVPDTVAESAQFGGGTGGVRLNTDITINILNHLGGNHTFFTSGPATPVTIFSNETRVTEATSGGILTLAQSTGSAVVNLDTSGELRVGNEGVLNIFDSAVVDAGELSLGAISTGDGTITIDGAGSELDITGTGAQAIGAQSSTGTLIVQNSGTVGFAGTLNIATDSVPGSSAVVDVLSSSTLTAQGDINVGTGTSTGQSATVTISGAGSQFVASGNNHAIVVGSTTGSTGRIDVQNGATWNDSGGGGDTLRVNPTGTIAIDDASWTGANNFVVAGGQVQVTNGGVMSTTFFALGDGSITVDGANSSLQSSAAAGATIGNAGGNASLIVSNNAVATAPLQFFDVASSGSTANTTGLVEVSAGGNLTFGALTVATGGGMNQSGTVRVTGTNSVLNVNTSTNDVEIGAASNSTGLLEVNSGGTFNALSTDIDVFATGTVSVDEGTVNSNGNLTVDEGTVMIAGGGSMSGNDAFIGFVDATTGSSVTVQGTGSNWNNSGTVLVGLFGEGTLNVEAGATATSNFSVFGEFENASGVATVTGTNSNWQVTNDLIVGNAGRGTLNITLGGSVTSARGFIASSFGSTGEVIVTGADSSLQTTGALYVGGNDLTSEGTGTVTVTSGSATIGGELRVWQDGTINLSNGGTMTTGASAITIETGGVLNINGGPIAGDTSGVFTANGPLTVHGQVNIPLQDNVATDPGGMLVANNGLTIDGGVVSLGKGVIDANEINLVNSGLLVFNGGTLHFNRLSADLHNLGGKFSPGRPGVNNGVGQTDIVDLFNQQEGELEIEIGGPVSGTDSDFVLVGGDANLGGDLLVTLTEDYLPAPEDFYVILNAENINFAFDNINSGGRIDTTGGEGSFLMTISQSASRGQITLSDFLADVDLDIDGDIDGQDFLDIQRTDLSLVPQWESQYPSASGSVRSPYTVPEPGCCALGLTLLGYWCTHPWRGLLIPR